MHIQHNIASSFYCHTCRLEFKMPLPPAKKQKTLACIREIQVHKLWTKVYSPRGLTAMGFPQLYATLAILKQLSLAWLISFYSDQLMKDQSSYLLHG